MNYTYLKYFADTARNGSVQKAASLNFVSQPAVSQGIKKLENELGISLLNHKRNSVEVTKPGKELLKASVGLFEAIRNYELEISRIQNNEVGEIIIGISNSLVAEVLAPAIRKFSKDYPLIDVKIKIGKTVDQIKMLERGEVDIGISIDNGKLEGFDTEVLRRGEFAIVGKKSTSNRLLLTEQRPETLLINSELKRSKNNPFKSQAEVESWSTIFDLVLSGYGAGFLPDFVSKKNKLKDFSLELNLAKPKYRIVSFKKRGMAHTKYMKAFCVYLKG